MNWRRSLAVLVLLASLGASVHAQAQPTDAAAEAKLHYEEGTKAYSLGEFPRAITEFKAAYNAKSDPVLLFNIAQSYRLAGDANQALFFYRSFLRNKPDAPGRRDVEKKIKDLEKQIAEGKPDGKPDGKPGVAPVPGSSPPSPASSQTGPTSTTSPLSTPSAPPPAVLAPPPSQSTGAAPSAPVEPLPSSTPKPLPTEPPPASLLPPPAHPASTTKTEAMGPQGVTANLGPEPAKSSPIYTKWWFWTGIGVVALLGLGLAASARQKVPHDDFDGPYEIKF